MWKGYRSNSSSVIIALVLLFTIGVSGRLQNSAQADQIVKTTGNIVFDHGFHDFGEVMEGEVVSHTFNFINEGPGAAKLIKTHSSCGCTTAKGVLKTYQPGEKGDMEISVDTRGKKGIVVKTTTLYLDNDEKSTVDLSLTMRLVTPPHPKVEDVLAINTDPKCKGCHLDNGVGQEGIFLYHRICAQCHGKKGRGRSASAFNDGIWAGQGDETYIRNAISAGIVEIGMPPYVVGVDPPLTDKQLDSLIDYIHTLDRQKSK